MAEMLHEIWISATPEKVFDAIATQEGLRGWWTADSRAEPRLGGSAEFGFDQRATVFRMRITEWKPVQAIAWECAGDPEEWKGTRLSWEITPRKSGSQLRFVHGNWREATSFFATCNSTWGELMHRLKAYAEGKSPGPHWTK